EAVLVGVELYGPQAARVAHGEGAAVGEAQREPVPDGVLAIAAVDERVAGGVVVDEDAPAHAEVQAEGGAGAVGVEQEQLAAAAGGGEPVAGQRGLERGG